MISRGEIGFVIASIGKTYSIISDEVYVALIVVIFITMLLPPILLRNSYLNDPSSVLPDYIRKETSPVKKPSKKTQEKVNNGD
jgi:Kef-type K+ transport system membrane component KefB